MTDFFTNLIAASKKDDFADVMERWMNTGVFKFVLPEVHEMTKCKQPKQWHPEGDTVWDHVLCAIRNVDLSEFDEADHWLIRLSIFFHDIGKPKAMSVTDEGVYRYLGHDAAGLGVFEKICERHNVTDQELIENIKFPIKNHMKLHLFDRMKQKKIDALVQHEKWPLLKSVGKADIFARKYDESGKQSHINCEEEYSWLAKYPHKEENNG